MSLSTAQALAWNLATTLMVGIILFKAGDGSFSVTPEAEFDGEPETVVHVYDPPIR